MNKVESLLTILGVKFEEPFDVIDNHNEHLGVFVFSKNFQEELVLMKFVKSTNRWIKAHDSAFADMIISAIRDKINITPSKINVYHNNPNVYKYNVKYHKRSAYPIYIYEVKKINDKMIRVKFINHEEKEVVKYYPSYVSRNNIPYCKFGSNSCARLYEGYIGHIVLTNMPKEKYNLIHKVANKYGTKVEYI